MSTATVRSSSVSLVNNIVGAGLFSMPWCLAQSSAITGALAFLLICVLNLTSFGLLAECCELSGSFSYLAIGKRAFGSTFGVVAQVCTMLYATGSLISYVVLLGDVLVGQGTGVIALCAGSGTFFGDGGFGARLVVSSLFSAAVFLPLSLMRSIDSLKMTSYLALLATLFAGFLCVYELAASPARSLTAAEEQKGRAALRASVHWLGFPVGLWEAIPSARRPAL